MTNPCTCKAEHWQPHAESCPAFERKPPQCIHIPDGSVVVSGELFDMACAAIAERDKLLSELDLLHSRCTMLGYLHYGSSGPDDPWQAKLDEVTKPLHAEIERLRAALNRVRKEEQELAGVTYHIANDALAGVTSEPPDGDWPTQDRHHGGTTIEEREAACVREKLYADVYSTWMKEWAGTVQIADLAPKKAQEALDAFDKAISPDPASREIRTINDVAAICHSVTGLCCHILGSPGGPCTINNCAAVRGYLGGPEFGEPASREAFDGLHKAGCAALELPHGRRSHCNCGAVKSPEQRIGAGIPPDGAPSMPSAIAVVMPSVCGKPMPDGKGAGQCINVPGHDGECDDMPF